MPVDRQACPFVLVLSNGEHKHPRPVPRQVPPPIASVIKECLRQMGSDVCGMTPSKLKTNDSVRARLSSILPSGVPVSLGALHPSLLNKDNLGKLIESVQLEAFPQGTGEEGVCQRILLNLFDFF